MPPTTASQGPGNRDPAGHRRDGGTVRPGRHMENTIMSALVRAGLVPRSYLLTTQGRKTGQPRTNPVVPVEHDGRRWLVAPYGPVSWVHNARAAGRVRLTRRRHTRDYAIREAAPDEAGPVLKRYVRLAPSTRRYFQAGKDSPVEDFVAEAQRHPVFELIPAVTITDLAIVCPAPRRPPSSRWSRWSSRWAAPPSPPPAATSSWQGQHRHQRVLADQHQGHRAETVLRLDHAAADGQQQHPGAQPQMPAGWTGTPPARSCPPTASPPTPANWAAPRPAGTCKAAATPPGRGYRWPVASEPPSRRPRAPFSSPSAMLAALAPGVIGDRRQVWNGCGATAPASRWLLPPAVPSGRPRRPGC